VGHTVQSFVETLRADGVEAGRKAAEEICRQAEQRAGQILREAESQAQTILAAAEKQRQETLERTRTDLELAARDTVARLREALNQAVNRVLGQKVAQTLNDEAFLKELIRDVANKYTDSDLVGSPTLDLNVSEPMQRKLAEWVIGTLYKRSEERKLSYELHGTLVSAGFEYKLNDGTIEVTPEAVTQVLSQIVTPPLQELLAANGQADPGQRA